MGTNAVTIVKNEKDKIIATLFKRYDGFPSGWGIDQANFLVKIKKRYSKNEIVEPFKFERQQNPEYFFHDGIEHLMPKMIAYFISIEKIQDISLIENPSKETKYKYTTSYFYEINLLQPELKIRFICRDYEGNILFDGGLKDFLKASHVFALEKE